MNKKKDSNPPLPWLDESDLFPSIDHAWGPGTDAPGLLAAGGDLSAKRLLEAYRLGIFPWFSQDQPILWWSTDPRMVLKPSHFKLHRSLKKSLQSSIQTPGCEIKIDHDFLNVIRSCSSSKRSGQRGTWITPEMIQAYFTLHLQGHAHSVETWINGEMVGGLYCVSIGHAVFGESMFSRVSNASKIALSALVCFAKANHIELIDCQQKTEHLTSLGGAPIAREEFLKSISKAQLLPSPEWLFKPDYWQELKLNSRELV